MFGQISYKNETHSQVQLITFSFMQNLRWSIMTDETQHPDSQRLRRSQCSPLSPLEAAPVLEVFQKRLGSLGHFYLDLQDQ